MSSPKYRITTNGKVFRIQQRVRPWVFWSWREIGFHDSADRVDPFEYDSWAEAQAEIARLSKLEPPFVPVGPP